MPLVRRSERQAENRSLGRILAVFIVLYILATVWFIIVA